MTPGRGVALLLLLASVAPGCAQLGNWLYGGASAPPPQQEIALSDGSGVYLVDMFELASGDPVTQAEVFADAEAAARLTPSTSSHLRYALALATPGHPGSDAERARALLRELLAQPELLTPVELSLATIHLGEVEERLQLDDMARRLQAENSRAASSEQRAVAQRIAAIESENRQLRESLEEAQEKLEAITSIERSIREQSESNDQR